MAKEQLRCNICGVPESQWEGGVCSACVRCSCEVTDDLIIEERVYRYAEKHGLLNGDSFHPETARKRLERVMANKRGPKYFREAISCDGQAFSSLSAFPIGQVFRVCRGSNDGSLPWLTSCGAHLVRTDSWTESISSKKLDAWSQNSAMQHCKALCLNPAIFLCRKDVSDRRLLSEPSSRNNVRYKRSDKRTGFRN